MVYLVRQNYKNNQRDFQKISQKIARIVGAKTSIEHVGSTAIPNMIGKNIIDVLIGVDSAKEVEKSAKALIRHGFYPGKSPDFTAYVFLASSKDETISGDVHLHVLIQASTKYQQFIVLRNYLLDNPTARKSYSDGKKRIIAEYGDDREKYKQEKNKIVQLLMRQAYDTKSKPSGSGSTRSQRTEQ